MICAYCPGSCLFKVMNVCYGTENFVYISLKFNMGARIEKYHKFNDNKQNVGSNIEFQLN